MRHNVCCVIVETHYAGFDYYVAFKQTKKRSWEIISIACNERKENCKVEKAFLNNQIAEPLTSHYKQRNKTSWEIISIAH